MARTSTKPTTTKTEAAPFSFADVEIGTVDALPKAVVMKQPNPLHDKVKAAADQGPQYIPVPDGDRAWQAHNFIRRAAQELGYGTQIRFTDENDQGLSPRQVQNNYTSPVFVYFVVTTERNTRPYTERRYNTDDIRKHFGLDAGATVTREQRAEFREAKGFNKVH